VRARVEEDLHAAVSTAYPDLPARILVTPIQDSIRLARCDQLETAIGGQRLHGRVSVLTRCTDPQRWSLYVTADVQIETSIVVTRRAIARGEVLKASDLGTEMIPMAQLRQTSVTDIANVVGQAAKRNLAAHRPLSITQIEMPNAVSKGDRVVIEHTSAVVRIQTTGIALSDGHVGEQIRVRNETSERIIRPWVLGKGRVGTRAAQ
jgi:flagella basal body P-ring formation protein FlgA